MPDPLDLDDDDRMELAAMLREAIARDRYFMSPRVKRLRAILDKLQPSAARRRPYPAPKAAAPLTALPNELGAAPTASGIPPTTRSSAPRRRRPRARPQRSCTNFIGGRGGRSGGSGAGFFQCCQRAAAGVGKGNSPRTGWQEERPKLAKRYRRVAPEPVSPPNITQRTNPPKQLSAHKFNQMSGCETAESSSLSMVPTLKKSGNRDESGNKAVLNRRGAILVRPKSDQCWEHRFSPLAMI